MKRLGLAVSSAILLVALVSGCTSGKNSSPEQLIDLVLSQCRAGEYKAAAQNFENGPGLWDRDQQFVRGFVNDLCANGQANHYKVRDRLDRGESTVLIQFTTYKNAEQKEGLRTMTWHFSRDGRKWLITKVE
ncbi:MAG: hypothetical protein ACOY94_03820 [Bacillota bacterium]